MAERESMEGEVVKDILIQVQEAPTGSVLPGVGVNTDGGLVGPVFVSDGGTVIIGGLPPFRTTGTDGELSCQSLDTLSPYLCEFLNHCGRLLVKWFGGQTESAPCAELPPDVLHHCPPLPVKPLPACGVVGGQVIIVPVKAETIQVMPLQVEVLKIMPVEVPGQSATWEPPTPPANQQAKAGQLFRKAEECRRLGNFEDAYRYYQEAHLVCPDSLHGIKAIRRLCEMDAERANQAAPVGGETQEPPIPMRNPRQSSSTGGPSSNGAGLQPMLPPIDATVVSVLEKILAEKVQSDGRGREE